jgi:hypothetical protein
VTSCVALRRVYTGPPVWSTRLNLRRWIQRLNDTVYTVPQMWTRQSISKWRQMNSCGKLLESSWQHWEAKLKALNAHYNNSFYTGEQVVTFCLLRVICGESPKVNQRRWTKVGHRQHVHQSTPLITSVERNCLHGSLWLIQPCWSTWGTRVNAPLCSEDDFLYDVRICTLKFHVTMLSPLAVGLNGTVSDLLVGRIMSMKNSNDTTGNRTRNLPVCSAIQPTACHHNIERKDKYSI